MNDPLNQVWSELRNADLVQGPAPEPGESESPWFVKALLAFSGWLAAAFLLGFLGAGFEIFAAHGGVALVVGTAMIAGAYTLLRAPGNPFVEHLALAISLAGQALLLYGLFEVIGDADTVTWLLAALVQAILAVVMPNFIHRVLSSFFASLSLAMAMADMRFPHLVAPLLLAASAWLWLNEFRYPGQMHKTRPIAYGLVLSVSLVSGLALFGVVTFGAIIGGDWPGSPTQRWVGELLTGAVLLYTAWRILRDLGHRVAEPSSIAVLLGSLAVAGLSMEAAGVTTGMTVLLLGFFGSNRVLTGLGIASLLFYISSYYYLTDTTLMEKAQILFAIGIALLATRFVVLFVARRAGGSNHA